MRPSVTITPPPAAGQAGHRAQLIHRGHANAVTAAVLAGHQAGAMVGLHHEVGGRQAVLRYMGRLPAALVLQDTQHHGGKVAPMHGRQGADAFGGFVGAAPHQPHIGAHRQPEQQCSDQRQNPGRHKHQGMTRITSRCS